MNPDRIISANVEKRLQFPLMEHYHTIQGEGYYAGKAAYFIRLGGCDVGCTWCDVKESWSVNGHPLASVSEITDRVIVSGANTVVITGGEPLMYNLDSLCEKLREKNIRIFLETSGAYPLSGQWDWVCISPKKFKFPLPEILGRADELKIVIYNKTDFNWAEKHAVLVKEACKLYLQPEWEHSQQMLPFIIDYVKAHPEWNISLQTHKFMNIP